VSIAAIQLIAEICTFHSEFSVILKLSSRVLTVVV